MIRDSWVVAMASSYAIARGVIAFVWFYHGLVPKLLGPHKDELAMNMALGLSRESAVWLANIGGILELIMAAAVLTFWRRQWPLLVTAAAMVGLLLFVLVTQPLLLMGAFNPVTTNLTVLALAVIALRLHAQVDMGQAGSREPE